MRLTAPGDLNPKPAWSRNDLIWLIVLILAATTVRIPGLNTGLWIDETATLYNFVLLPIDEIVSDYQSRNNHVLYSLLAHFSVDQFGTSAWALRLPAVIFGVLTIPATYYLGRQLASRHEAILATAFLVFSYHHVWFSQNARGYSGLLFGCVLASVFLVRLVGLKKPGLGTVFGYAVVVALTCWVQLLGGALILAHGQIWLALVIPLPGHSNSKNQSWHAYPRLLLALALAGLFTLLLYLPALKPVVTEIVVAPEQGSGPVVWQSHRWLLTELWNGAARAVPGGWPVAALGWLTLALGVGSYARRSLVSASILLLPLAVTLTMVAVLTNIIFPRFFLGSLAFFLLLGVRGGCGMGRLVLPRLENRQLFVVGLAVALATAAMVPRAWLPKQDFIAARDWLSAHRQPGDAVACAGGIARSMQLYAGVDCYWAVSVDELIAIEETNERTWLVYAFPGQLLDLSPGIQDKLRSDYTVVTTFDGTVVGGDIVIALKDGTEAQIKR